MTSKPLILLVSTAIAAGLLSGTAAANSVKIYKYQDAHGNLAFSDRPPVDTEFKELFYDCYACGNQNQVDFFTVPLITDKFEDEILAAHEQSGISIGLIRAMIHAESGFNHRAKSSKGAIGLTQLMPKTADELGVDPYDDAQNILGGSMYMATLLKRYNGDLQKAGAAYNAGPGAVDQHNGPPPFAETTEYLKRLTTLYQRYEQLEQTSTN